MTESLVGYWMRPSDANDSVSDYLWIGKDGRMVHRINYKHGPFVMTLWSRKVDGDTYEVRLKPKSNGHRVVLKCEGPVLQMEHLDLMNPRAEFSRILEGQISSLFAEDIEWAIRTMNGLENKGGK